MTHNFELCLADPTKSLYYKIDADSLAGDPIEAERSYKRFYLIDFEEINWIEESGECTNYGVGKDFMSMADCVSKTQEKIFEPLIGCLPPWLAGPDNSVACQGQISVMQDSIYAMQNNISILTDQIEAMKIEDQVQACLKPCRELKAKSKLRSRKEQKFSMFQKTVLTFSRSVKAGLCLKY